MKGKRMRKKQGKTVVRMILLLIAFWFISKISFAETFTYDLNGRLKTYSSSSFDIVYVHDDRDNLLFRTVSSEYQNGYYSRDKNKDLIYILKGKSKEETDELYKYLLEQKKNVKEIKSLEELRKSKTPSLIINMTNQDLSSIKTNIVNIGENKLKFLNRTDEIQNKKDISNKRNYNRKTEIKIDFNKVKKRSLVMVPELSLEKNERNNFNKIGLRFKLNSKGKRAIKALVDWLLR